MEQQRDEQLWQQAKKRAGFQRSLASYFVVNTFLSLIWWFTAGKNGDNRDLRQYGQCLDGALGYCFNT